MRKCPSRIRLRSLPTQRQKSNSIITAPPGISYRAVFFDFFIFQHKNIPPWGLRTGIGFDILLPLTIVCCGFLWLKRGKMKKTNVKTLVMAALFLALALILPFLTGQIPEVGSMLCPMHIPALLCGFFCGWPWGLAVGLIAPLLRSLLFGMPPMFPVAICMSFELATYGAISGALYSKLPAKKSSVYVALLTAMVAGRLVWGAARLLCAGLDVSAFGLSAFWAGAITTAIPGIIVQIVLIPLLVMALEKYNPVKSKA